MTAPAQEVIRAKVLLHDAKAWVVNLACGKPKDHDLATELWTLSALARYVANLRKKLAFSAWRVLPVNGVAYFE